MPSIDIAVHMRELHAQYGATGPLSMGAYYGAAYLLMLLLRLPGSAFAQGEQELVTYSYTLITTDRLIDCSVILIAFLCLSVCLSVCLSLRTV